MYVDLGLIDLESGDSHFDSQAFYDLLEIASLLPEEVILDPNYSLYGRMATGEQIFTIAGIAGPLAFTRYETILGDLTILGYPSDKGGVHGALMRSNIGLSASSDHPDAAWSFIRKYLLPYTHEHLVYYTPLRIDVFDKEVRVAMGGAFEWSTRDGGVEIPMLPLTEEGAKEFRELVESISFVSRFDYTFANILLEELPPFLAGSRSAEETARVFQNRVQRYLHERN